MSEVKNYGDKFRSIEIRLNCNFEGWLNVIENIKNLEIKKYHYIGIGGIEIGEKDSYDNVEHVHILLISKDPIIVQTHINRLGWKKYKNFDDNNIGYHIMSIDKKFTIDRIIYISKKITKISEIRFIYQYLDDNFWNYINEVKIEKAKAVKNKCPIETQKERLRIAKDVCYDDILTSVDWNILQHKGFFNKNEGRNFYASVRNKEMEEIIAKDGDHYECIPESKDWRKSGDKGYIKPWHNILIKGDAGDGKTQTMKWYIKEVLKEKAYTVRAVKFMDRYEPRKYDKLFCDELDAKKICEMGGECFLKESTCGTSFTYEEKYVKSLLSDYKPWWITSNLTTLLDLKDKNDKNDDGSLDPALRRRFHVITLKQFCLNFGIKFISRGVYKLVDPVPLYHYKSKSSNGGYRIRYIDEDIKLEEFEK